MEASKQGKPGGRGGTCGKGGRGGKGGKGGHRQEAVAAPRDAVQLMSAHQSKGLEWPVVFCVRFNDDEFPSSAADDGGGDDSEGGGRQKRKLSEQEERRLAYVALSRAKKDLCISYVATDAEGRPSAPLSRFLRDVPSELVEKGQRYSTAKETGDACAPGLGLERGQGGQPTGGAPSSAWRRFLANPEQRAASPGRDRGRDQARRNKVPKRSRQHCEQGTGASRGEVAAAASSGSGNMQAQRQSPPPLPPPLQPLPPLPPPLPRSLPVTTEPARATVADHHAAVVNVEQAAAAVRPSSHPSQTVAAGAMNVAASCGKENAMLPTGRRQKKIRRTFVGIDDDDDDDDNTVDGGVGTNSKTG